MGCIGLTQQMVVEIGFAETIRHRITYSACTRGRGCMLFLILLLRILSITYNLNVECAFLFQKPNCIMF